jgi:hypothetical protein
VISLNDLINILSNQGSIITYMIIRLLRPTIGLSIVIHRVNHIFERFMGFFVKLSHSHSCCEFTIVWVQNVQVCNCLGQEIVKLSGFNTYRDDIIDLRVMYHFKHKQESCLLPILSSGISSRDHL